MGVPVIDFSKLDGSDRAETMARIAECCEEWGFFQLVNHGIPVELLERVKKACSDWYTAEREGAFKDSVPAQLLNKLIDAGEDGTLKDVDWEDVVTLQGDAANWPLLPAQFRDAIVEYRAELRKLAERVMEVMDENMGLDKGYTQRAFRGGEPSREPFFGTKVSHYPPCPRPDLTTGLRAHTDAGGVILLFQDDRVGGLQVLRGGEWVDVQPLENAIVVNTGDQIEVLSNGRYKSALHRVVTAAEGTRRSIASFYNPAYEATIAPAKALVDEKKAEAAEEEGAGGGSYPEFVFGDYMAVYGKQKFMAKEPRFQAVRAI